VRPAATAVLAGVLAAAVVLLTWRPAPRSRRVLPASWRCRAIRLPARLRPARRTAPSLLDVADLADRLAALCRAGVPEGRVWQLLAAAGGPGSPECGVVAGMVQAGGGASEGLRRAATAPGALPGLGHLAVVLDVVRRSGAPPAELLEQLAASLRSDAGAELERQTALAGPQATARLLSALPLGGLLLGWAIGADPLGVLLGTPPGRACLVAGAVLWASGRYWTMRMVAAAARAGR
jgi:tight adherence protein B